MSDSSSEDPAEPKRRETSPLPDDLGRDAAARGGRGLAAGGGADILAAESATTLGPPKAPVAAPRNPFFVSERPPQPDVRAIGTRRSSAAPGIGASRFSTATKDVWAEQRPYSVPSRTISSLTRSGRPRSWSEPRRSWSGLDPSSRSRIIVRAASVAISVPGGASPAGMGTVNDNGPPALRAATVTEDTLPSCTKP